MGVRLRGRRKSRGLRGMIRLVAMDVDGTLTDGCFYMDGSGGELKRFHAHDGYGIVQLLKSGVEVAFISGRYSAATEQRAMNLGVKRVINGTSDKLPLLIGIANELGLTEREVAYIGDDMPDIECIRWAGLGIAVADSRKEILEAADLVMPSRGGYGAVRDAADYIIKLNQKSNCHRPGKTIKKSAKLRTEEDTSWQEEGPF